MPPASGQWTAPVQAGPWQPHGAPPPQQPGPAPATYQSGQPYPYQDSAPPTQHWSAAPGQQAWPATTPPGSPSWSNVPSSGQPASGAPAPSWQPVGSWGPPVTYPSEGDRAADSRRIVPSPPPQGRGRAVGLVAGVVVAVLAAGTGGYFLGHSGGGSSPSPKSSTAPKADDLNALPPYEASQLAINRAKLDGELSALAQPWLGTVAACAVNGEQDGPKLGNDESKHVFCRYGAVSLHFVEFKSVPQKDSARNFRAQLNLNGDGIAPGLEPASRKTGGVSKAPGKYVEYAYRDSGGRALCGIWWDRDDDANGALMMETLCEEGLGGKWDPLRDLWQRHS